MSVLTKVESGYLYETDFSTLTTDWELSDLSRVKLDDGLTIDKGEESFFMFLSMLTKEKKFVLDVENVYNPTRPNELGGIVIYANEDNYICLEEYYDPIKGVTMTYPWLRLVRDHNVYTGYWSNDGVNWNLVGVNDFGEQAPKVGLFLEGTRFSMKVNYLRAFKDLNVDVINPPRGKMQLLSEGGVLESLEKPTFSSRISYPISRHGVPLNGRFRWENEGDYAETEFLRNIWGGDVYRFQIAMDLYYFDGQEYKRVETNKEEFLGHLNSLGTGSSLEQNVVKMKLRNSHNYEFTEVQIKTDEYREFTEYREYVSISEDGSEYGEEIEVGQVGKFQEYDFFLKITRGDSPLTSVDEVLFAIKVYSQVEV